MNDDILSRAMPGEDAPEGVAQVASTDVERALNPGHRHHQQEAARNWPQLVDAANQGRTQR